MNAHKHNLKVLERRRQDLAKVQAEMQAADRTYGPEHHITNILKDAFIFELNRYKLAAHAVSTTAALMNEMEGDS